MGLWMDKSKQGQIFGHQGKLSDEVELFGSR